MPESPAKTKKGERTRATIVDASLALFVERGYDATTMRAIAERAGVSVGNAYYYFPSKDALIHEYYARSHAAHLERCAPLLEGETRFVERLRAALRTNIEAIDPEHRFAGVLFRTAGDPASPLHPMSEESRPVRDEAIALYGRVVEGSKAKVPKDLAPELPRLLWLLSMGIVLFWMHDRSEGRRRTYRLVDASSEIVARLLTVASLPPLRPLRRSALALLRELEG